MFSNSIEDIIAAISNYITSSYLLSCLEQFWDVNNKYTHNLFFVSTAKEHSVPLCSKMFLQPCGEVRGVCCCCCLIHSSSWATAFCSTSSLQIMTQHFGARRQKEIESMKDVTTSSVKRMLKISQCNIRPNQICYFSVRGVCTDPSGICTLRFYFTQGLTSNWLFKAWLILVDL